MKLDLKWIKISVGRDEAPLSLKVEDLVRGNQAEGRRDEEGLCEGDKVKRGCLI